MSLDRRLVLLCTEGGENDDGEGVEGVQLIHYWTTYSKKFSR